MAILKKTVSLYPNCKSDHTGNKCSFIDFDTLKLFCEFCCRNMKATKLNLTEDKARKTFHEIIERNIKIAQDSKNVKNYLILRKLKKANGKQAKELPQIYKQLKLYYRLYSLEPLCSKHLNKGEYVEPTKLKFKCTECLDIFRNLYNLADLNGEVDKDILYTLDQNNWLFFELDKTIIIDLVLDKCKELKTAVFTPSVLAFLKERKSDDFSCKNFIIEVSVMLKSKNETLNNKSCCLSCGTRFVLGKRAPVLLHEIPLHEICYKCFSKKINKCPIDGTIFAGELRTLTSDTLYILPKFKCNFYCETSFHQHNSNQAFETECGHTACKTCWNKTPPDFQCPKCGFVQTKKNKQNLYMRRKLKYLEVLCEEHKAPSEFFDPILKTATCRDCSIPKGEPINQFTAVKKLSLAILDYIIEFPTSKIIMNSIHHFIKCANFIPLQQCYDLYHELKSLTENSIPYMRFDSIFPYNEASNFRWYQLQPEKIVFEINCNCSINVLSIMFGRPFDESKKISVFTNTGEPLYIGKIKRVRNLSITKFKQIQFSRALLVKGNCIFSIEYDLGMYVHGKFDAEITPGLIIEKILEIDQQRIKISVKQIEAQSQSIGNQTFGGPLLGLELANLQPYSSNMPSMQICYEGK